MTRIQCLMVLLSLWLIGWTGFVSAAPEGDFELYSASSALDGKPVTVRLNTNNGDSWFFDGGRWQKMLETGNKNQYKTSSYKLALNDSSQGLVLIRFSVRNGSAWIYTSQGWDYIEEPDP